MPRSNNVALGEQRERALLTLIRQSRMIADLPDVPDPDRHLDAPKGQRKVNGRAFDFAWDGAKLLVELDGGQWLKGGGRHGSDDDRWKTNEAVARGWKVMHFSAAQIEGDPARVLEMLARALTIGDPVGEVAEG